MNFRGLWWHPMSNQCWYMNYGFAMIPKLTTAGRSGCPASANRYVYVEDSFSNSCRNNRECCWPFLTFLPLLLLLLTPAIVIPDWRALGGKNELRATAWGCTARVTLPNPNACIWENPSKAQNRLQIWSQQHCEVLQADCEGFKDVLTRKFGDHGRMVWTRFITGLSVCMFNIIK